MVGGLCTEAARGLVLGVLREEIRVLQGLIRHWGGGFRREMRLPYCLLPAPLPLGVIFSEFP